MSTIIAANISDGTTSVASTYVVNGSTKVWVNFNGTGTPAIRGSMNVGSITDNGTGLYTVNFTTAMPDINYSAIASTRRNNGTVGENNANQGVSFRGLSGYSTAFTTTAVQLLSGVITGESAYDSDFVAVQITR